MSEWVTIGACRVGLAHHRHRVFIAATHGQRVDADRWPVARRTSGGWETVADTLFGAGDYPTWPSAGVVSGGTVWAEQIPVCGVADGVMLPTPTATPYGSNQSSSPGAAVRPSLEGVVQMLPTPRSGEGWSVGRRASEGWRPSLVESLLPTPRARDGKGRDPNPRGHDLNQAVSLLPTPTARDGMSGPGHAATAEGAPDLRTVAATLLPTPRATDGAKGGPNQRGSSGDLALPSAVMQMLPVAHASRWGVYGAAIARHEQVAGMPAPEPTEPGRNGPRLAPQFVEWLQALPAGHVTDHLGRSAALRALGNGVVPAQAAAALSLLLPSREVVPA